MLPDEQAAIGYALSFLAFVGLATRLTFRSSPGPVSRTILIAAVATALWSITLALNAAGWLESKQLTLAAEWIRNISWLAVMFVTLGAASGASRWMLPLSKLIIYGGVTLAIFLTFVFAVPMAIAASTVAQSSSLAFAVFMLILCEQLLRNVQASHRQSAGYICIAVAGMFLYELVSNLPFEFVAQQLASIRTAQGYSAAVFCLPLILGHWQPISSAGSELEDRHFLFSVISLITFAAVLLFLSIADYYVRAIGGPWRHVMQITLISGAACLAAVVIFSPGSRRQIRVFLTKSFLRYKYDYRKEWLRFIGTLSETGLDHLPRTSVQAIARIVNSPGGVVWVLDEDGQRYNPVGAWQHLLPLEKRFSSDSSLVHFMTELQWVIDLSEMQSYPSMYGDLELDPWFIEDDKWWILVPMLLGNELYGFVALLKAPAFSSLNFEDHDLLRTVGRHVATHMKQAELDRQLSEAQQFSAYHRLSAFLMHDLNNLAAQQSLVVQNAEKHRHDPKFIDDTIATIANSVSRMHRLLAQLSNASEKPDGQQIAVVSILEKAVKRSKLRLPAPSLSFEPDRPVILADAERLCGAFEHLIRNAQDATDDAGEITIEVRAANQVVSICIRDNGSGMSKEFISERLFRPFDSTKGSQSMGIGAYQAREYFRLIGGQLDVASEPGVGTTFSIELPTVQ